MVQGQPEYFMRGLYSVADTDGKAVDTSSAKGERTLKCVLRLEYVRTHRLVLLWPLAGPDRVHLRFIGSSVPSATTAQSPTKQEKQPAGLVADSAA